MLEYILILLAAVFCSNIINRLLPRLSVPIIQIILGVIIALIPLEFHLELKPDIFLILFIAPIIFHNSIHADKKSLWKLKVPIFSLAFGLVIVGTIIGGYFVHWLIPVIPLAAACALIAALGPTDVVAVSSFSEEFKIPRSLFNILNGECLFNDASGIVSFQFAIAAVMTGGFSLAMAGAELLIMPIGGVLVGLALTGVKYLIAKWIRTLGLENVTLHLLLEILTPFSIYITAEVMGVSGVIAVVISGIVHSFAKRNFIPHNVSLNTASASVWSMLSYTLDGLIFLILGTQLPDIDKTMNNEAFSLSVWQVLFYILSITAFLFVLRLLWSLVSISKKSICEKGMSRFKSALICTLSGTRGAITLGIVMSIPAFLNDGAEFPEHDLIILISAGVILCTLLMANFLLPLMADKKENIGNTEITAYIIMLQNIITMLKRQATPENKTAVRKVSMIYYTRIADLKQKQRMTPVESEEEKRIRALIPIWQKEYVHEMLRNGEIDEEVAARYLEFTAYIEKRSIRPHSSSLVWWRFLLRRFWHHERSNDSRHENHHTFPIIKQKTDTYVLDKLYQTQTQQPDILHSIISNYEATASFLSAEFDLINASAENVEWETAALSFQMERDAIQHMLETGKISRETAKDMRATVLQIETQLDEKGWEND